MSVVMKAEESAVTGRLRAVVDLSNDHEVVVTYEFGAPIELVFDVVTNPEHVRKTIAPFGEAVKVSTIDLRVGGPYHFVFVTAAGVECSFRGTYLEVAPPTRTGATWHFDGWPDVEAIESTILHEDHARTTLTVSRRSTASKPISTMSKMS